MSIHRTIFMIVLIIVLTACTVPAGDSTGEGDAPATDSTETTEAAETTEDATTAEEDTDADTASGVVYLGEAEPLPVVEGEAEPVLPATATSDLGGEVTVEDISKIVTMSEDTIETIIALGLGDNVILGPSNNPMPEAADIPTVPAGQNMTVEGILALEPTLVFGANMTRHTDLITGVLEIGVPSVMVDRNRPAPEKIRMIATTLGVPERGEALAQIVEEKFAQAAEIAEAVPESEWPTVLLVSGRGAGNSGDATAAGESTPAHDVITRAGAINAGALAGLDRYQAVTAEGVITMAPDIVLVSQIDLEMLGGPEGIWERVPGLAQTPAAENQRLVVMPDLALRAGAVSSGTGALLLAQYLHGTD